MNAYIRLFLVLFLAVNGLSHLLSQGVAVNGNGAAPDPSAILDVTSTNQGVLVPRLTEAQKIAIADPATGLLIYQTDATAGFWYFDGSIWTQPGASGGGGLSHFIGEIYGGGIVIAVWKNDLNVETGWIMSLTDVGTPAWSNVNTQVGVSAQSRTNGAANTNGIIAQPGHTSSAAKTCTDYNAGGFSDWYLPAIEELKYIYNNMMVLNTILGANAILQDYYWSSTERSDLNYPWVWYFGNGTQDYQGKSNNSPIRCMRKF